MEIYKDIKGYEGVYKVSNFGNVKSVDRIDCASKKLKGKQKVPIFNGHGYVRVGLHKCGRQKMCTIHGLVWDHFGSQGRHNSGLQIDHIDNDKANNHISNLQLLTHRENVSKGALLRHKHSKYTGVTFSKDRNKWVAHIRIKGKQYSLGRFIHEIDAFFAYKEALSLIRAN